MRQIRIALLTALCVMLLGGVALAAAKVISTPKAPAAIGPYSQAIEANGVIYVSGQLPIDPATGKMPAEVADQAKQSLENIKAILEAAGSGMDQVVMVNIFVQDMNHFKVVNDIYAKYFTANFPARATVQVARLPRDALVEISAIAVKK